ncbi:FtsW/RodA/SpoVE family cell cycle protein [Cephaloticoccus primus]|uniref:FtsW/RodA/SpoVE family cell cycle protein n=1 Tax=Cephaloticoccus primus TaxID=1548207 RepID=UPI000837D946|nr:putative peptidoglycan glycosyltransferase FtsW [Cephaloticoccus primus]
MPRAHSKDIIDALDAAAQSPRGARRPASRPHSPSLNPAALIVVCAVALTILGLTILFSASVGFARGPYYYLGKQCIGVALAVGVCLVTSRINLDWLRRHVWVLAVGLAVLLVLVLIPGLGIEVNGSRRWLGVGSLRLQVSEFAKFGLVFCLAHYLAINQVRIGEFKRGFLIPIVIVLIPAGLIVLEPDYGTSALVVAVGLLLLFLAGAKWRYILTTGGAVLAAFALLVINNPNRLYRLVSFLDVEANKQEGTYQLYQALAAFAAGGVEGVGLGQGRQQLHYLPEAHTDFILAVVAEELGLWATMGIVTIYAVIFIAGLMHLRRAPNLFQFLLVAGCLLLICLQAIINLGVVTGLFPTKGMSLPFISAGLSNLLLMALLVGVMINTQRAWPRAALAGQRSRRGGLGMPRSVALSPAQGEEPL